MLDRVLPVDASMLELSEAKIDFDVLQEHIGFKVHQCVLLLQRQFVLYAGRRRIRPMTFNVLVLVGANPGVSQSQLVSALSIDKGTVARLVAELEAVGWVESVSRARDRRLKGVYLAPEGVRVVEHLKGTVQRCTQHVDTAFSPDERRLLLKLLSRVITTCGGGAKG